MARVTERITDPKVMIAHMTRKIMSMRDHRAAKIKLIALKMFCEVTGYGYVFEKCVRTTLPLEIENAKSPVDFLPPPASNTDTTAEDFLKDLDEELKK